MCRYKKRAFEDALDAFGALIGLNLWKHRPKLVRCLHWENALPTTTPRGAPGCLYDAEQSLGPRRVVCALREQC